MYEKVSMSSISILPELYGKTQNCVVRAHEKLRPHNFCLQTVSKSPASQQQTDRVKLH
jgi:hypothetical protein